MGKLKTKKIARQIVEMGQITKVEDGHGWIVDVTNIVGHRGLYAKSKQVERNTTTVDGEKITDTVYQRTTKQQAMDMAIDDITDKITNNEIVLSDTWSDENARVE